MSATTGGHGRRVLLLLPAPPRLDAIEGGAKVTAQLMAALSRRHEVAAVYLRRPEEPPADDRIAAQCAFVTEVRLPADPPLARRLARRLAPLRAIPSWAAFTYEPRFAREVRERVATWDPDIVQFEYHVMGQYVTAVGSTRARRILTEHEAGVLAAAEHLMRGRPAGSLGVRLEHRAWARFERRVIARMDAVVVFAERDEAALRPLAGATPIVRIGIGVAVPPTPLDPVGTARPSELVFIGNFIHPPNVDAATRLGGRIFPRVRARRPELTLRIVGANPPDDVRALAGSGITVTGRVPDVTPYLDAAALVVVPLTLGSGVRVKVAEALAHGKAVVASPRALEGLPIESGVHACVAETDDEFVARIVELLDDGGARRRALGTNAYAWAQRHFGAEPWADGYTALYERLLRGAT